MPCGRCPVQGSKEEASVHRCFFGRTRGISTPRPLHSSISPSISSRCVTTWVPSSSGVRSDCHSARRTSSKAGMSLHLGGVTESEIQHTQVSVIYAFLQPSIYHLPGRVLLRLFRKLLRDKVDKVPFKKLGTRRTRQGGGGHFASQSLTSHFGPPLNRTPLNLAPSLTRRCKLQKPSAEPHGAMPRHR